MAVDYSVPSWIHGANPLQALTAGSELGLRIAEANNRSAIAWAELQRRQQEFQQEVSMQQQRLEAQKVAQQQQFAAEQQMHQERQLYDEQKLQVENAYRQGQLELQQQKLNLTANAAAEKANASGKFLQSLNTLTSGYMAEEGLTEDQARARAVPQALYDSGMFQYVNPASLAGMARSASGKEGRWERSPSGYPVFVTAQGGLHFEPRPVPEVNLEDKEKIKDTTREIQAIQKELMAVQSNVGLSDAKKQEAVIPIQERLYNAQAKRHKIFQKAQQTVQPPVQQSEQPTEAPAVETRTFGAPQKGQVISGYEFQGGDPADQKNWKLASDQEDDSEE